MEVFSGGSKTRCFLSFKNLSVLTYELLIDIIHAQNSTSRCLRVALCMGFSNANSPGVLNTVVTLWKHMHMYCIMTNK